MTNALLFLIAAIVIFIIAAALAFGVGTVSLLTIVGLIAVGLACATAAKLVP